MRFNWELIILLYGFVLYGQEKPFMEFEKLDRGLSNNWVSSIAQDSLGFIWIGTQDGLNRYDGYTFEVLRNSPAKLNSLPANWVQDVVVGKDHELYIATYGGGVSRFLPQQMQFINFALDSTYAFPGKIISSLEYHSNSILAQASDDGVFLLDIENNTIQNIGARLDHISMIFYQNNLWLSDENNLYLWNTVDSKVELMFQFQQPILLLESLSKGKLLVALQNELVVISEGNILSRIPILKPPVSYTHSNGRAFVASKERLFELDMKQWELIEQETKSLFSGKTIQTVFLDRQESLWIGTDKGLFKEKNYLKAFQEEPLELHARRIFKANGSLYIGGDGGLHSIGRDNQELLLKDRSVVGLHAKANTVWVGTYGARIFKFVNNELEKSILLTPDSTSIYTVFGLATDRKNRLWVGAWNGIYLIDSDDTVVDFISLKTESGNEEAKIMRLHIDKKDRLWATTSAYGVFKIDSISNWSAGKGHSAIRNYRTQRGDNRSLTSDIITTMEEGSNGELWFGTDIGLVQYKEETDNFDRFQYQGKLFDKKIMAVRWDGNNALWTTTINDGIYRHNFSDNSIRHFTKDDGLISNAFLYGSGYFDQKSQKMYFGTDEGIQTIDVSGSFSENNNFSPIITAFITNQGTISPIQSSFESSLTLQPFQNDFSVQFSALDFNNPEKIGYAYAMDDDNWKLTDLQTAYFTNVAYGKHQLKVKTIYNGSSHDTSILTLKLYIRPPWYRSLWAYIAYSLAFILLLYFIYQLLLRRKLAVAEAQKTAEIDEAKSKMYANISHEFRTPLTLIEGLSGSLLKNHKGTPLAREQIQTIRQSGKVMLNLVTQMLDLVSLDSKQMTVNYQKGDLVAFVKECVSLYKWYTDSKGQQLLFSSDISEHYMDVDDDKLQKILNNLLSNAVKFTPEGGTITVTIGIQDSWAILTVADTGTGISTQEIPRVFDRYYKTFDLDSNVGSGIGMALTKELVELLEGQILVESEKGKGTQFKVLLPIRQIEGDLGTFTYQLPFIEPYTKQPIEEKNQNSQLQHTILIVEDNDQVLHYVTHLLSGLYRIQIARNGKEGLQISKEKSVDFIISDVMMPVMDGFEFCKAIKNDIKTSHIPFVMVTAKTQTKDTLKGHGLGVDAYLHKPFNEKELLLIVKNLLRKKERQIQYFKKLLGLKTVHKDEEDVNALDVDFIKRIQEYALEKNQVSVEILARELLTSRTQLHRKIKSLTGMSITQYLNYIRIEKAKSLLSLTKLTIGEIAYEVGFEDPQYFSKVFKNLVGSTPSVYREDL